MRLPEVTNELVLAAHCIASNNTSVSGGLLFDIHKDFDKWKREWIIKRMVALYGDKARIESNHPNT